MKLLEVGRFRLACLIACIASKKAIKVPEDRRVYLASLVVYTNELCCKVLKGKRVHLIYLVFYIANNQNHKSIERSNLFYLCQACMQ